MWFPIVGGPPPRASVPLEEMPRQGLMPSGRVWSSIVFVDSRRRENRPDLPNARPIFRAVGFNYVD